MEYGLRGSNLRRSVYEPFTTKKTAETENFEGKHVPLSANIQRFFELIVQRVISTLQFWGFWSFSPSRMTLLIGFCVAQVRHPQRYAPTCRSRRGEAPLGSSFFSLRVEARSAEDRRRRRCIKVNDPARVSHLPVRQSVRHPGGVVGSCNALSPGHRGYAPRPGAKKRAPTRGASASR